MTALSAAEIAQARADQAALLPDLATIQRKTLTTDGAGGFTETYPTVATGVPCRLSRVTSRGDLLKVAGERIADQTTHRIAFAAGTDVRVGDRLAIGAATFEVVFLAVAGAWELARHALARETPA